MADSLSMKFHSICDRFSWRGAGAAIAWLAWATHVAAADQSCHAASGPRTTPLVELFTSEGCDSCPPADRWVSTRFPAKPADAGAVAIAFHVDYWDGPAWRDRFASAQFTQRQYDAMRANRATFVVTPQVLVQGHDAPDWRRGRIDESLAVIAARAAGASIALDVDAAPEGLRVAASARVHDVESHRHAVLWLAYTDSGHATEVAGGENRGVRLVHDHVVRSLHGPYAMNADGSAKANLAIVAPGESGTSPVIVAFVQDRSNGDVLQVLALPSCSSR
jgi:hypothetical protein